MAEDITGSPEPRKRTAKKTAGDSGAARKVAPPAAKAAAKRATTARKATGAAAGSPAAPVVPTEPIPAPAPTGTTASRRKAAPTKSASTSKKVIPAAPAAPRVAKAAPAAKAAPPAAKAAQAAPAAKAAVGKKAAPAVKKAAPAVKKAAPAAKKAAPAVKKAAPAAKKAATAKKAAPAAKKATKAAPSAATAAAEQQTPAPAVVPEPVVAAQEATGRKGTAKKAAARKAPTAPARKAGKKAAKKAAKRGVPARETAGAAAAADLAPDVDRAPVAAAAMSAEPGLDGQGAMPDPAQVERTWLASYPPGVPETYPYPEVPLTRLLDDAAKDFPQQVAIEFLGKTMTYKQLLDQVDRFATALRNLGVNKGDRVGIVLPNCPQHVIAIFAALRIGAIVAENNPLYTETELEHQINDAGCKVLVILDPVYQKIGKLKGRLRTVEHVVSTGLQDYLPGAKSKLFALKYRKDPSVYYQIPAGEGVQRFTELIARTPPTATQVDVDPRDDLAMLVYTGGTTGVSKGVMLTHYNLVTNAFQGRLWMPDVQAGRENVLCVMPFFHSYGLTTCLTLGMLSAATLTLLPRFERDTVLKTIDKRKPTLFPGVPTIYVALNGAPNVKKFDLTSIRACLSGAAPLPVEVATTFENLTGGKLREGYGLTETSPITHANPIYGKAKKGHIGLPVTDTVCTLLDLEDPSRPAPPGEPGELAIWGPQVMKGYWNRPDETEQVLKDGWLLTGDIASMDDEGYFAIVDRKKDMIIAGGFNIYPRDIEEVLYTHPKVEKAVVAGIPDEYRGETVKAYIVTKPGQTATEAEIDEFLRGKLAAYKVPKQYEFRSELPETMVGKVLRRKLIEEELAKQRA